MGALERLPPREELQRELEVRLAPALDWLERYLAIFLGRRPRHVADDKRGELLHACAAQLVEFFYELAAVADDPDPHRLERYVLDMMTKFGTESVSDDGARPASLEEWADAVAKMAAPLKGWPNRSPWRYRERHRHYRAFLASIVQRGAFENALSFLNETVEYGLLPQFQKVMTGQFLPEAEQKAALDPRWIRLTAGDLARLDGTLTAQGYGRWR
ncbi:MAG: hypothetical protein M1118_04865, partial [Chloroflexi bacterium]|nr:hypothetical protein [Chloroflexota bacterium]